MLLQSDLMTRMKLQIDAEQFGRDGFCVARGLFSVREVETLRTTFMEQARDGPVQGLSDIRKDFDPADPLSRYPRIMHPQGRAWACGCRSTMPIAAMGGW